MGVIRDNAACNAILLVSIEPFPQFADKSTIHAIMAIMTQIRASLTRFRDVDSLSAYFAQDTAFMKQPSFIELTLELTTPQPGYIIVNSTWRYGFFTCILLGSRAYPCVRDISFDWTSAHFGYPNQTRFHQCTRLVPRYVRIYTPNPILLPDGKTWESRSGDFEATFCVVKDVKERFEKVLKDNVRELEMPGDVEFV
jgi:hypothetical protein